MSLKNIRERTSNIGKLGRLLVGQTKNADKRVVEQAMRYLVSQLKVNFRPLYPETVQALASLADARGETLWTIVWDELQRTTNARVTHAADLDWEEPEWTKVWTGKPTHDQQVDEEEVEFRCLSLNKGRHVLSKAWAAGHDTAALDQQEIEVSSIFF